MNHWMKAKAVRQWREAAHILAKTHRIPACQRVQIQLNYVPRDKRRRDPLNLVASLKACEDGIVDAGVIPDDNSAHHTSVMPLIHPAGPERCQGNRLWLQITRLA